jgi:hypothetical protein
MPKEGEAPTFYMASYLLDAMCARNIFADMNIRWHVANLPVHVYSNILWENRYKKSYPLICDEFISLIYFIIFKKEFPRLSVEAKKMIEKVGHWHLDEHKGVWGHWSTTSPSLPCPSVSLCGRNMLSNHPVGL